MCVHFNIQVLKAIADNSLGGMFSDVQNTDDLTKAFSMCLAGLLMVVVEELTLTVTQIEDESTIEQSPDNAVGSITVTFGVLYSKEVRKVIVDLLLTAVDNERGAEVLQISYSYR